MNISSRLLVFGLALVFTIVGERVAAGAKPLPLKREVTEAIFAELKVPFFKGTGVELDPRKLSEDYSFTHEQLEDYFKAGPAFDDIKKDPMKFENAFPLRVAQVEAIVQMVRMSEREEELPDILHAPNDDKLKKSITDKWQRVITVIQSELGELDDQLGEIDKQRDQEESKGWRIQCNYVRALVRLRLVSCYEYNLALGRVKLGMLPELDDTAGHICWRLAATEKIHSPRAIRDLADKAKKTLAQIVIDHPKTPWAVLAEKHKEMKLGLEWQPAKLE